MDDEIITKKYLLFAGNDYYPEGGFEDFISTYDSVESAKQSVSKYSFDWAHIVDIESKKIVLYGYREWPNMVTQGDWKWRNE